MTYVSRIMLSGSYVDNNTHTRYIPNKGLTDKYHTNTSFKVLITKYNRITLQRFVKNMK